MTDKIITNYTFSYTDADGSQVCFDKNFDEENDLLTWTHVIYDVANAMKVVYGYDIVGSISVKGVPLEELAMNDFMPHPFNHDSETEEDNFPEAKSGLTD